MGNHNSSNLAGDQAHVDMSKFDETDVDNDEKVSMAEFQAIYLVKTGQRPSWHDWKNFMECDVHRKFEISKFDYINYMRSRGKATSDPGRRLRPPAIGLGDEPVSVEKIDLRD